MPNYQNGKIYMIESLEGNCRYYGSSITTLARRLAEHRSTIKRGKKYITSKEVLKYSDARILLVESFPCNSKMELEAKEATYIRNNDCVNKCIPQRSRKEYRQDNKDEIKEYQKEYRQDHKEVIKEYREQYRRDNKEVIKEYEKQYYEDNKETILCKLLKKCLCDCGKIYSHCHYNRHTRSQQHQFYQKTYDFIMS